MKEFEQPVISAPFKAAVHVDRQRSIIKPSFKNCPVYRRSKHRNGQNFRNFLPKSGSISSSLASKWNHWGCLLPMGSSIWTLLIKRWVRSQQPPGRKVKACSWIYANNIPILSQASITNGWQKELMNG